MENLEMLIDEFYNKVLFEDVDDLPNILEKLNVDFKDEGIVFSSDFIYDENTTDCKFYFTDINNSKNYEILITAFDMEVNEIE